MFKKLFKNKPIGFYFSLAASLLSLFMMIFYAVYMSKHEFFNAGVLILYLLAVLSPVVYFFVKENALSRSVPIFQTTFLALAFGITVASVGRTIVFFLMKAQNLLDTSVSGNVLLFILIFTGVTLLISFVACFMKQTKQLTAEQQAEVDEDWSSFKTNTKAFAVKHKKPLIISGAGMVALIVILILLFAVIIPKALVVHVDTVKFAQNEIVMYETEKLQLETTIAPDDAENKNLSFSSSDKEVATVTESGVVEALSVGETTITVIAEDGEISATCKIEVKELTVQATTIQKMPNTVHYLYGENEKFSSSGISIVATLTNGKTEKISKSKHKLAYSAPDANMSDGDIIVNSAEVPITATYTYRGETFSTSFNVYGDAAEIDGSETFNTKLADPNIGYMILEDDLQLDSLTLNRDLGIEGNIAVSTLTLDDGATLTMADGRITSDSDMTISGDGKIVATGFETASLPGQDRSEHAAIRVNGRLSINGADVECSNLAAGSMTVKGGAVVTVYGKRVNINRNAWFGDVNYWGVNGVHLNGTLNVSGAGTVLEVLYNDAEYGSSPAAIETTGVTVDGATLTVGSNEGCASWGYGIWGNNDAHMTIKNNASVAFSMEINNACFVGINNVEVLGASTFVIDAPHYFDRTVNAIIDKTATVTVGGVAFDMSQPVNEMKLGDMTATLDNVTISVDKNKTYFAGDTFDGDGILINVLFSGGSSSDINVMFNAGFTTEEKVLAEGDNTVKITVGDKEFDFTITAMPALSDGTAYVSTSDEFTEALGDSSIDKIIVSGELTFEDLTIDRSVTVYGNLNTDALTVNDGATLTMADGRITSENDLTINGGGTVIATAYSPDGGSRPDFAAIYAPGDITISGNTVIECKYIYSVGSLIVTDGADVTVYGDDSLADNGQGINGVHQDGEGSSVTVSDGATLKILYNVETYNEGNPAALEAHDITVSGATLIVGSSEGCADWGYAVWGKGHAFITSENDATVTFDVGDEIGLGGTSGLIVSDTSTFTIIAGDYLGGNMVAEIDSTATVTVGGVAFDMSKDIDERTFGDMAFTSADSATIDGTKTYYAGDKVATEDITVKVTYDEITITLDTGFTVEDKALVEGENTVNVMIGESTLGCSVYAYPAQTSSTATVSDADSFNTALGTDTVTEIYINGDFALDSVTIDRDITVHGNLKTAALTVNEGATLTMADGKIWSDGNLAITGAGKIVATEFSAVNGSARNDFAAIYAAGELTISGVTVECYLIYTTGNITINNGANVTVYSDNTYINNDGMNGIHAENSSTLTVSGSDTVLNVLYTAAQRDKTPAAFQLGHIVVDGATLYVGSEEGCESWGYAVWFEGSGNTITITNGAQVTIDADASSSDTHWGRVICSSNVSDISISVTEGTSSGETTKFVVYTSSEVGFSKSMVAEGENLVEVYYN